MADQKSRGGQKDVIGRAAEPKQQRHTHPDNDKAPRREKHMKEDTQRGKKGR